MDTNGLILGCWVTPASVSDREGAKELFRRVWLSHPDLHIFADGNYDGPLVADGPLVEWAKTCWNYALEIVTKPEGQTGFSVLPRRWVVERTYAVLSFAWLGQWRRLAKDYEQKITNNRRGQKWPSSRLP